MSTTRRWGGLSELRGLYCTRLKPADGIEADCHLPGYSANDCEAQHALETGTRLALPAARVNQGLERAASVVKLIDAPADKAYAKKLDRTTADLRTRQKEERLSLIAKDDPKPIHIPATRKRRPEEHAAAVRELEEQLAVATAEPIRKAG
jgi:hypothetical protein